MIPIVRQNRQLLTILAFRDVRLGPTNQYQRRHRVAMANERCDYWLPVVEVAGIESEASRGLTCDCVCGCKKHDCPGAANARQAGVISGQPLAPIDTRLRRVVQIWPELSEEIRDAISRLGEMT